MLIFVTDDEPAIRTAIVKRLLRRHHRVEGFESGEVLLKALEHDTPDLVMLDLKMPGMSGLDVLKQLRPLAPHTLVVMLTAYGTGKTAAKAMKRGPTNFLIKAFDLEGMNPVLNRAWSCCH